MGIFNRTNLKNITHKQPRFTNPARFEVRFGGGLTLVLERTLVGTVMANVKGQLKSRNDNTVREGQVLPVGWLPKEPVVIPCVCVVGKDVQPMRDFAVLIYPNGTIDHYSRGNVKGPIDIKGTNSYMLEPESYESSLQWLVDNE